MQPSKLFSWFLAGYLVLLLNLGSSLHRITVFGLHSGCCDSVQTVEVATPSCCCTHQHDDLEDQAPAQDKDAQLKTVHDCSFCKFFDQFQVVISVFTIDTNEEVRTVGPFLKPTLLPAFSFDAIARGPPVC